MTNTLVQKITTDADAAAAAIKAEAAAAVAVIEQETARVVEELTAQAETKLTKEKDQLELVILAKANQAAKIAQAAAKRTAIDELFAAVKASMLAESGAAYVARYTNCAKAVLPEGVTVTGVAAPADKLAETKEITASLGITAEVTAASTVTAGLIISTTDGVYDISFDRIMSEARPNLEMELVHTNS